MTSFLIPEGATGYWVDRLRAHQVDVEGPVQRFDGEAVSFRDPDGLVNELVSRTAVRPGESWHDGPVPREHAIVGFAGVTLYSRQPDDTTALMTEKLGFEARI